MSKRTNDINNKQWQHMTEYKQECKHVRIYSKIQCILCRFRRFFLITSKRFEVNHFEHSFGNGQTWLLIIGFLWFGLPRFAGYCIVCFFSFGVAWQHGICFPSHFPLSVVFACTTVGYLIFTSEAYEYRPYGYQILALVIVISTSWRAHALRLT